MQVMNGALYALAGLIVWVAFVYRRPLAFPRWLYGPAVLESPVRRGDLFRAAGALFFLLLLEAVPDAVRGFTGREPSGFFGPGFSYVVFLLGGWVAGRFGGRFGLASVLAFILAFRILIPLVLIPVGLFFIESAVKGQVFIERVMEVWTPLLLLAPYALVFTLASAMAGAWQVYRKNPNAKGNGEKPLVDNVSVVNED